MQFIENSVHGENIQEKIERWETCTLCHLCKTRTQVVLWRGYLPAEILFIGEAPGKTEDADGFPFVGPAGNKLDDILSQTRDELFEDCGRRFPSFAITNLIACIPKGGKDTRPPTKEEIAACQPRLEEMVKYCSPQLVVRVGKLATGYKTKLPTVDMVHPSSILQADRSQQGVMTRKAVSVLFNGILRHVEK